ncbi:2-polyprenyl-6-methoxyphenol hydroxylase and related FAD-dependent oxidoreductase [Actinokineospora spheciospongiae]|uniref:2-polyprenyl-6-methoxyphenol hydroxylase and related FAD-dependent oxidoreductase n=1 Tax=Actinokineospora spheciospongiae TaxID=909613 RepID=W7ISJ4_9PSEU|nr:FAD-dependent monooxygenase [Actinokineospora spheciospongiae]EWC63323.1 2-polyprenyl-6-methoxyphenol hydroxylase and related FAD-dependent oxidoreductase [Actinokineospora spheciospongiae]
MTALADLRVDFCVVGGGPAGLTLALLLARSGARVVVVERSRSLDRAYRGEILQPGGQALLAGLGVLDGARDRGAHPHRRFRFVDRDRVLVDIDYGRLPGPHNCLLSVPQPHLLGELLAAAERHGAVHLAAHRVTDLVRADGRVEGVVTRCAEGERVVLAHCVVAADGRFSKVRRLAGIPEDRIDVFDQDVLWFKLPLTDATPDAVQIFRAMGNPVLAYKSYPDTVQIGWTFPHHGYRPLAARGLDHLREQIALAVPAYADQVREHLTRLGDLSVLDVFSGTARHWVADGLVLLGDAAHTHSPIGAQGINLAVQDAVLAHPLLMASKAAGDATAAFLGRFPSARRADIAKVVRLQQLQSRAMLSQGGLVSAVRPTAARVMSRTPVFRKVLNRLAYGNPRIRIATELFVR